MKSKRFAGWLPHIVPLDFDISLDGLTEEDVSSVLSGGQAHVPPRLFGQISAEQILKDLEEHGMTAQLAERGYTDLEADIEKVSPFEEAMRLHARHPDLTEPACLVDLRAHWGLLKVPGLGEPKALVWDWIEFADPTAKFPPLRPPLPGQSHPGLSLFRPLVEIMKGYVAHTEARALVAVPQYFHNAVLYWRNPSLGLRFFDPLRQGQLMAQIRDLQPAGLALASWAFEDNRVEQQAGQGQPWEPCPWTPAELVLTTDAEIREYLDSPEQHARIEEGQAYHYRIGAPRAGHPDEVPR